MARLISFVVLSLGISFVLGPRGYADDKKEGDFVFSGVGPPESIGSQACEDKTGDASCFPATTCFKIDPAFVLPDDPNSVLRKSVNKSAIDYNWGNCVNSTFTNTCLKYPGVKCASLGFYGQEGCKGTVQFKDIYMPGACDSSPVNPPGGG